MGVLLYVLLCGVLPFEDESLPRLYKKIQNGKFYEPDFLSPLSKDLLRAMLQVNPRHRISMKDLREHKWVTKSYTSPLKWSTVYDKNIIDTEVALELAFFHGVSTQKMVNKLKEWQYNYLTATYLILLKKKELNLSFSLPMYRAANKIEHVLHSPTIHKSLENDLDVAHEDFTNDKLGHDRVSDTSTGAVACVSPVSKFIRSPHLANRRNIDIGTPIISARQKQRLAKEGQLTPAFTDNKENYASVRVRGPIKLEKNGANSIYATPARPVMPAMGSNRHAYNRTRSTERNPNFYTPDSAVSTMDDSSQSANSRDCGTPRSRSKTSQIPRRVFTSLERGGAKLKNLLTPKKFSTAKDEPMCLNLQEGTKLANLSITSSNDAAKVREQLLKVLLELDIAVTANK